MSPSARVDQHRQHPIRREPHEANVLQGDALNTRRHYKAQLSGVIREHLRGELHGVCGVHRLERAIEGATLVLPDLAEREQSVDEVADAFLGGHPARRGVRLLDQTETGQLAEGVPHAGRRQPNAQQIRNRLGAHRRRAAHVGGHERAQHTSLALRQLENVFRRMRESHENLNEFEGSWLHPSARPSTQQADRSAGRL